MYQFIKSCSGETCSPHNYSIAKYPAGDWPAHLPPEGEWDEWQETKYYSSTQEAYVEYKLSNAWNNPHFLTAWNAILGKFHGMANKEVFYHGSTDVVDKPTTALWNDFYFNSYQEGQMMTGVIDLDFAIPTNELIAIGKIFDELDSTEQEQFQALVRVGQHRGSNNYIEQIANHIIPVGTLSTESEFVLVDKYFNYK